MVADRVDETRTTTATTTGSVGTDRHVTRPEALRSLLFRGLGNLDTCELSKVSNTSSRQRSIIHDLCPVGYTTRKMSEEEVVYTYTLFSLGHFRLCRLTPYARLYLCSWVRFLTRPSPTRIPTPTRGPGHTGRGRTDVNLRYGVPCESSRPTSPLVPGPPDTGVPRGSTLLFVDRSRTRESGLSRSSGLGRSLEDHCGLNPTGIHWTPPLPPDLTKGRYTSY